MPEFHVGDTISVSLPSEPTWPAYVYRVAGITRSGQGLYVSVGHNAYKLIEVDKPGQLVEVIDQEQARAIERARR